MSDVEMGPAGDVLAAAFDPDQDPEEKRNVRRKYRSLQKAVEEKQNPNDYTAQDLAEQVREADTLFGKVKGPQEATLDSAFLLMASNMGAQKARAMKSGGSAFDIDEFVSKLITFMGGRKIMDDQIMSDDEEDNDGDAPLDWERIGCKALAKSRRVPVLDFMLGPLSIEQKQRATVVRSKLEKNKHQERKPQEIKEEDIARSENETTKNVSKLADILEAHGDPVNLFVFVINPNDFAQTVENIFYLSFLIRDGKVAMDITENGEPTIYRCEPPSPEDFVDGLKKQQIVMEFDMATWRKAIEVFEITECMIPPREKGGTKIGNKWYG